MMETKTSHLTAAANRLTQERSPDNPSVWCTAFTFPAYLEGFRVQGRLAHNGVLCIYLDYRTAYALDVYPTITISGSAKQVLEWIQSHVPVSWEKNWLVEHFTRQDTNIYFQACRKLYMAQAEVFEADRQAEREWMASPEFRRQQFQQLMLEMAEPELATKFLDRVKTTP